MRSPASVIEAQLEAYNRRDIDAFAATYAPDVRIMDIDESRPPLVGIEALREVFGQKTFAKAGLNAEIRSRMVVGNKIVDHEITTWDGIPEPLESLVVYEVVNELIKNVWFFKPTQPTTTKTEA